MSHPRVFVHSFKDDLKNGIKAPAESILIKHAGSEVTKSNDPNSRLITFTISTETVDRDGDTLAVAGWDLENYKKNPVVLWDHDPHQLPIAQCVAIFVENNKLKATARFPTADVYPFADTVYKLLLDGCLNATSVGFQPLEWTQADGSDRQGVMPLDFSKQALLEWSVVSVPANPEALLESKSLGAEQWQSYSRYLERCLDTGSITATQGQIEKAYNISKNASVHVSVPAAIETAPVAEPDSDSIYEEIDTLFKTALVMPTYSEVTMSVEKAGRAISAANLQALKDAMDMHKAGMKSHKMAMESATDCMGAHAKAVDHMTKSVEAHKEAMGFHQKCYKALKDIHDNTNPPANNEAGDMNSAEANSANSNQEDDSGKAAPIAETKVAEKTLDLSKFNKDEVQAAIKLLMSEALTNEVRRLQGKD